VLLVFSDGTRRIISLELVGEFMAESRGLFDQSLFAGGKPN
jgi:hypothetical protein